MLLHLLHTDAPQILQYSTYATGSISLTITFSRCGNICHLSPSVSQNSTKGTKSKWNSVVVNISFLCLRLIFFDILFSFSAKHKYGYICNSNSFDLYRTRIT